MQNIHCIYYLWAVDQLVPLSKCICTCIRLINGTYLLESDIVLKPYVSVFELNIKGILTVCRHCFLSLWVPLRLHYWFYTCTCIYKCVCLHIFCIQWSHELGSDYILIVLNNSCIPNIENKSWVSEQQSIPGMLSIYIGRHNAY